MKHLDDELDEVSEQKAQAFVTLLKAELADHPEVGDAAARAVFPEALDPARQEKFAEMARQWSANSRQRQQRRWEQLQARLSALPPTPIGAPQPQARFFEPVLALLKEAANASSETSARVQDALQRAAGDVSRLMTPGPALASAASGADVFWSAEIEVDTQSTDQETTEEARLRGTLAIDENGGVLIDALIVQPSRDWRDWNAFLWVETNEQGWLPVGTLQVAPNGLLDGTLTPQGFILAQGLEPRLQLRLSRRSQ